MKMKIYILSAIFICLFVQTSMAGVIYVKKEAAGAQTGATWATAFHSLTQALSAASAGDKIWVAAGTYTPGNNRTDYFALKNNVIVYGGFAGNEGVLEDRDWKNNKSILSGDIGQAGVETDNCYHVFYHKNLNLNASAVLDGFTIQGGNSFDYGGGMCNYASSPSILNCIFEANLASLKGGGIHNEDADLTIKNCAFINNRAGSAGGGIYHESGSLAIENSDFIDNRTGNYGEGAGIFMSKGAATITNSAFISNAAGENFGLGGGINCDGSQELVTVTNSYFSNNSAMSGAGIRGGNLHVTNCTFWENKASYSGGGIDGSYQTVVANTILWNNTIDQVGGAQLSGAAKVSFSNIMGGYPGPGNINIDPQFIDPNGIDDISGTMDDNFHLSVNSPCIDAGSNGAWSLPAADLEHNIRIMDGNSDTNCTVDMGVYEQDGKSDCPVPSDVWVDDDWAGAKAEDHIQAYVFGSTAFSQIQHAINAIGTQGNIHLAAGTYIETLWMKSGAKIFGSGMDTTIIDGNQEGPVITAKDVDYTAQIKDVRIQNGKSSTGGGLCLINSTIKLNTLTVLDNKAYYSYTTADKWYPERQKARGGGAYILGGAPSINDCVFSGNTSSTANGQEALGGGLYCEDANATIYNTIFNGNYAIDYGGGMHVLNATPFLSNCEFKLNAVSKNGGALFITESDALLQDNRFFQNSASKKGGAVYATQSTLLLSHGIVDENKAHAGGGAYVQNTTLTIKDSRISNNIASADNEGSGTGGGVMAIDAVADFSFVNFYTNRAILKTKDPSYSAKAGAYYGKGGEQKFSHCLFKGNASGLGGAVAIEGGAVLNACTLDSNSAAYSGGGVSITGNASLTNTVFYNNSSYSGGAAAIGDSNAFLTNCTFAKNTAEKGNAISTGIINYLNIPNSVQIANSIFWDDENQISNEISIDQADITITYSNIKNGYQGEGNIDIDPLFCDINHGNLHLLPGSPCIDKGNNTAQKIPEKDMDQEPRIMSGGSDIGKIVDMGADEFSDPDSLFIIQSSPQGIIDHGFDFIDITFSTPIHLSTFTSEDIDLSGMSGEQLPTQVAFREEIGNQQIYRISFDRQEKGTFVLVITPQIQGINGSLLNQDQDDTAGESGEDAYESFIMAAPSEYGITTSVTPDNTGTIRVEPTGNTFINGTQITLTAQPVHPGVLFDSWSGDIEGSVNPITVLMDGDKTVVANFKSNRIKGDINADGKLNLQDAGISLTVLTGVHNTTVRSDYKPSQIDINGDDQIGPVDLLFILQKNSNIRKE
ncbi:MAG: choice-of-anchor Q domain-containing protein [Pseudomonadota bacterium]